MNIYVCLFTEEEDSLWHHHLTRTLDKMGHRVFIPSRIGLQDSFYLIGQGLWNKHHKQQLTERVLADVRIKNKEYGIDLFFCYLFPFQFTPGLFKELTRISIPSVYFFCDNLSHKIIAKEYAPFVTLNWVPEPQAIKQFQDSDSKAIYLPMAANPQINYPLAADEIIDISFVGLRTPFRCEILGEAFKSGLNLRIYGNGWQVSKKIGDKKVNTKSNDRLSYYLKLYKSKISGIIKYLLTFKAKHNFDSYIKTGKRYGSILEPILNSEPLFDVCRAHPANLLDLMQVNKIYSLSSVSIGFNDQFNESDGFFTHTNLRNFEAVMAGACYLAQDTPDLGELFLDGEEIMIFHNAAELIDKAKFLLNNESFRRKLRIACRRRALSEHTWEQRFNKVFSLLGIS